MAKRFTDTEKWKKTWFRNLKPKHKCFWQYLTDNCNHAGIWEVDFGLASYFIGTKIDEQEIREIFEKQFTEIDDGKRWFVRDFIDFQYGCLNENNNAHRSVLVLLKKYGVEQGLTCPSSGALVKDKDKEKDMDKDTPAGKTRHFFEIIDSKTEPEYNETIAELVEKTGLTEAFVEREVGKFSLYWTEPTKSGKAQRWEKQAAFEVRRRLATWFRNAEEFSNKK